MKIKLIVPLVLISALLITGCQNSDNIDKSDSSSSATDSAATKAFDISDVTWETPVASVGNHVVTYAKYKMTLETYESYYKEVGFDVRQDETTFRGFQERTLNSLLQDCVLIERAYSEGFDQLSEEAQSVLDESIEQEIASLSNRYIDQVEEEYSQDNTINKEERIKELIAAESYSATGIYLTYDEYLDYIRNYLTEDAYVNAMKDSTVADVEVSEDKVKEAYDSSLASDKETYTSSPDKFGEAFDSANEIPPLYAPEGYSKIYALFFSASDAVNNSEYQDNITRMRELAQKYGETAIGSQLGLDVGSTSLADLASEYKELYTENTEIRVALAQTPISEANSALSRLKSGEAFEDVMSTFDQNVTPRAISPLYTNDVDWETSVKNAFTRLTPGSYSDIIETSTGYYIIYYIEDFPSGEYSYDAVHDTIYQRLLTSAQEEVWKSATEKWMADADTTINEELMYATRKDQ